ncbi:MAG TPA: hypothetical protein VJB12_02550, partial [Candidatus Nanoarchaeia archaeon]|nr:hypothetical protein [Candidatus Nanoarchaeia archaeon]
ISVPFVLNNSNAFLGLVEDQVEIPLLITNVGDEPITLHVSPEGIRGFDVDVASFEIDNSSGCAQTSMGVRDEEISLLPLQSKEIALLISSAEGDGVYTGTINFESDQAVFPLHFSFIQAPKESAWYFGDGVISRQEGKEPIYFSMDSNKNPDEVSKFNERRFSITAQNHGAKKIEPSVLLLKIYLMNTTGQEETKRLVHESSYEVPSLDFKENHIAFFGWIPQEEGEYVAEFGYVVDNDWNAENNQFNHEFTVILPRLEILAGTNDAPVIVGKENLYEVGVINLGDVAFDPVIGVIDYFEESFSHLNKLLWPSISYVETALFPISHDKKGDHLIFFGVDQKNDPLQDDNSYLIEAIAVHEGPDLEVSHEAPDNISMGQASQINVTLSNLGLSPAQNATVRVLLGSSVLFEQNIPNIPRLDYYHNALGLPCEESCTPSCLYLSGCSTFRKYWDLATTQVECNEECIGSCLESCSDDPDHEIPSQIKLSFNISANESGVVRIESIAVIEGEEDESDNRFSSMLSIRSNEDIPREMPPQQSRANQSQNALVAQISSSFVPFAPLASFSVSAGDSPLVSLSQSANLMIQSPSNISDISIMERGDAPILSIYGGSKLKETMGITAVTYKKKKDQDLLFEAIHVRKLGWEYSHARFSNISPSFSAQGFSPYICRNWNLSAGRCYSRWEKQGTFQNGFSV